MKLNAKVAVALMALSSIGCASGAYISNTVSKTDSPVKTQTQSYGSSTRVVADFNGDAILDMLISTTQGLVARLGKNDNTYRKDTLIYRVDASSGMAPGDITTWFNPETAKQMTFFSLPTEVSQWSVDGKKKFSKETLGIPMDNEQLTLTDRVNNTILEDGNNVWGITASKNSIYSYNLYNEKIAKKKKDDKYDYVQQKLLLSVEQRIGPNEKPIAPDIAAGYFSKDGLLGIAVLQPDTIYFLNMKSSSQDSLVLNYEKGISLDPLKEIVTNDSIDENSLKIFSITTKDGDRDNLLVGYGSYLLDFKFDSAENRYLCEKFYKMPLQKTSAKLNYNINTRKNANGNIFVNVYPETGEMIGYIYTEGGLKENFNRSKNNSK
ncbi:MAG TPA: hypothetical protein VEC16_04170 [Alphaproteobacteria bacterium]|nr:hypothetical protein [Alphaproteobacteria bacterium]